MYYNVTLAGMGITMVAVRKGSSSPSIGATTLGGFWFALRFRSTILYLYISVSNFSLASALNLLLLVRAISVFVFLLVLMNMVPTQFFDSSYCVHSDYMCCPV